MNRCSQCQPQKPPNPTRPPTFRPGLGAWATEEEYARRRRICAACDALLAGHTCAHCGCLAAYRSAFKDRLCPHPQGNRWKPTT